MEEIIIDIDESGNVQVEGKGIVGEDCVKLTKDIEEALGEVTGRKLKPEYLQKRTVPNKLAR